MSGLFGWGRSDLGYDAFNGGLKGGNGSLLNGPAGMSQAEWQWYQANIATVQQKQLQQALDPATMARNVSQADADVNTEFANVGSANSRTMGNMGVSISQPQQSAFDKSSALAKGIATAGAENAARSTTAAQKNQILGA